VDSGEVVLASTCMCVCSAGYIDHMSCLKQVEEDERGYRLDCYGIYPQVLRLSYEWAIGDGQGHKYADETEPMTQDLIIYWSWAAEHLYVLHTSDSVHAPVCITL